VIQTGNSAWMTHPVTGSYYFGVLKWAGDESVGSSLPSLSALLHKEFGLELKTGRNPPSQFSEGFSK